MTSTEPYTCFWEPSDDDIIIIIILIVIRTLWRVVRDNIVIKRARVLLTREKYLSQPVYEDCVFYCNSIKLSNNLT